MMHMLIEVRLFATFRKGRWKSKSMEVDKDSKIEDVLELLNIDVKDLSIALINGRHSQIDDSLEDKDILALFPPVGGG